MGCLGRGGLGLPIIPRNTDKTEILIHSVGIFPRNNENHSEPIPQIFSDPNFDGNPKGDLSFAIFICPCPYSVEDILLKKGGPREGGGVYLHELS